MGLADITRAFGAVSRARATFDAPLDVSVDTPFDASVDAPFDAPADPSSPSVEPDLGAALAELEAEFRNYRDRVDRQREESIAAGVSSVVVELLDTLDYAELWASHVAASDSPESRALVGVHELLRGALVKVGLEPIDSVGAAFDPLRHDPIELDDDPVGPGPSVTSILRPGYAFRGVVVRPALIRLNTGS